MRAPSRHFRIADTVRKLAFAGAVACVFSAIHPLPAAFAQSATSQATSAQSSPATLVADKVQVMGNSGLLAQGNVLIHFNGKTLNASSVRYDQQGDQLIIKGPIVLQDGDEQVIFASSAELSGDLKNGILRSARLVLNQQLQVAAVEINRIQGRYTQLNKVVASSCQVCAKYPVPLWQIRAERVVHDQKERLLYFHNAQFRIADVPVFYLPRLRMPDPTLKRATGLLAPKIRTNSAFGTGILAPFFIRLGDHADVTLSPFIAEKTRTLEWRYRQAFHSGDLSFSGAISDDSILPGETRFYIFGEGDFDLPLDFKLKFQLQDVSDPGYLLDYGYSDEDQLRSAIAITRARRDEFVYAGVTRHETLRADEIPVSDQLPFAQADLIYERRWVPGWIGGMASYQLSAQSYFRESSADQLGRDVTRLGAQLDWTRDWQFTSGAILSFETAVKSGLYWIEQDSDYASEQSFITPSAAVTLRWPLSRVAANGTLDVIEPVAQLAWSQKIGANLPNEDSNFVEFDEANLFSMSRYPGFDAIESGARANLGLKWSRTSPSGWAMTLAAGRVFRFDGAENFSDASGLAGESSDWLIAGQIQLGSRLAMQGRALIDDNFDIAKTESRIAYLGDDWQLSAAHLWVVADAQEGRTDKIHELRLDGAYQINDFWRLSANGDFDLEAQQATRGELGLQYSNECVKVDFSLSRRFTATTIAKTSTDVGLQVELLGFGGATGKKARQCLR